MDVWNALIQRPLYGVDAFIRLTPERVRKLELLFAEIFENSQDLLASWESFCEKIARNRYLMGARQESLYITFDWVINPKNARKILEGNLVNRRAPSAASTGSDFGRFDREGTMIECSSGEYGARLRSIAE